MDVRGRFGVVVAGPGSAGEILAVDVKIEQVQPIAQRLFGVLARNVVSVGLGELNANRLRRAAAVVAEVMSSLADAIDVAESLQKSGFEGRLVLFTDANIDAKLVASEVRQAAPDVLFDIFHLGNMPRLIAS